ncbi:zinc finger protein 26-like isoform X8 [Athalia rosae]|uniref:zinc finger protein 26-like isoform X8 n=1 Tax=Athalia rosae TaxID=37344 RepID=UPI00203419AB|nr:zinc finger protein 26-like isoform X8 [Athalia rosae]
MSSLDYLDLCRLCLVKDGVSVPIFEGEGDVRQIFLKIAACLPVKVAREDKLPKKICDNCVYKVELLYQFWNTTANAEKQLLQWLGEVGLEDKQGYVTGVLNTSTMKEEDDASSVIQSSIATTTPQSGIGIGVIDNIGLGMPFSGTTHQQQLPPTIPINQPIHQALPGPSNQPAPDQLSQTQGNATTRPQDEEEESSEEEDNSDDDCDADDGLPVKEESEEDLGNSRNIEPTTFVNVSLACDEAGPSGLQQQKNTTEIPELSMPQTLNESDAKSGSEFNDADDFTKHTSEEIILDEDKYAKCHTQTYQTSTENRTSETREQKTIKGPTEMLDVVQGSKNCKPPTNLGPLERRSSKEKRRLRYKQQKLTYPIQPMYECEICGKRMRNRILFTKHKQNHDQISAENRCEECDKDFSNDEKFEKHKVKVHQEDRPFPCVLCGKCFKTKEFLKTHLKQHNKKFTCDICGISKVSGYDLRLHKKKHNQEFVTYCKICHKGFYTNQTLERHLLTHTGEKPFACKICNTPYASAAYLNMHMKSHGQRDKHKCTICDFESFWKAALKVHMKIHTGENQITCEICGKSVSSKTYLQVHMRIHSGEKPHICEVCGKEFSVRKYLIVHLRTHTGERPYECKFCQKRFTQKGSMNSHLKGHTHGNS